MVTDEMRRDLAAKLRDVGDGDGMAEEWQELTCNEDA